MAHGAVLFDVDGTLVDSSWIHTVAWARAFRDVGEVVPMHRIHPLVGMGADRLIREVLGRDEPAASEAHHAEYEAMRPEVRVLPGARELVRAVHEAGLRAVLASSSKQDELDFLREVLEVEDWIAGATSSTDAEESKPAGDIFAAGLRIAGVDPGHAVTVGDTAWDVRSAAEVGLPCIGVLTGGWREAELRDAGAVEVHRDAAALLDALSSSAIAPLLG